LEKSLRRDLRSLGSVPAICEPANESLGSDATDATPVLKKIHPAVTPDECNRRQAGEFSLASGCTPTDAFVEMGQRMSTFPATECCCARLFCNVRNIVGGFRHALDPILRDLVTIRMDVIWGQERKSQNMFEAVASLYRSITNFPEEEPDEPFQSDDSGL
jgi:hypothetical protein